MRINLTCVNVKSWHAWRSLVPSSFVVQFPSFFVDEQPHWHIKEDNARNRLMRTTLSIHSFFSVDSRSLQRSIVSRNSSESIAMDIAKSGRRVFVLLVLPLINHTRPLQPLYPFVHSPLCLLRWTNTWKIQASPVFTSRVFVGWWYAAYDYITILLSEVFSFDCVWELINVSEG